MSCKSTSGDIERDGSSSHQIISPASSDRTLMMAFWPSKFCMKTPSGHLHCSIEFVLPLANVHSMGCCTANSAFQPRFIDHLHLIQHFRDQCRKWPLALWWHLLSQTLLGYHLFHNHYPIIESDCDSLAASVVVEEPR